ncbi:MAG: hypothetical protein LUB61_01800 [Eggerthellaceae bacterium]|nr:hypothetical protein [Eggerthellaceae bacterium]
MYNNDELNIGADEFPPKEHEPVTYYLNGENESLSPSPVSRCAVLSYNSGSDAAKLRFAIKFNKDVSFAGYPMVKLSGSGTREL